MGKGSARNGAVRGHLGKQIGLKDQRLVGENEGLGSAMPLNSSEVSSSDIFSAQFVCIYSVDIEDQPRRAGVRITGVCVKHPSCVWYTVVTSYQEKLGKWVAEVSCAGGRDWVGR